jgi:hypothetical protein
MYFWTGMIWSWSTERIRQYTISRCENSQNLDCFIVKALTGVHALRKLIDSLAIVRALKMSSHVLNPVEELQYDPSRPHLSKIVIVLQSSASLM